MVARRVCFRVDAGQEHGLGHLVRSTAIGRVLRDKHGLEVFFISNPAEVISEWATREGFHVVQNDSETEERFIQRCVRDVDPDLLVIDRKYDYSHEFASALRTSLKLVLLDNPCAGAFAADLAIFPAPHVLEETLADSRWLPGQMLAGPEYVVINDSVRSQSKENSRETGNESPLRLVVTTGGSDPRGMLSTLLAWITEVDLGVEITGLVGDAFVHTEALTELESYANPRLRMSPYNLSELASADLALCQFGITVYELLYLGVPTLTVAHNTENASASKVLAERHKCTVDLGELDSMSPDRLRNAIRDLLRDSGRRDEMSRRGRVLVDGLGAARVADAIAKLTSSVGPDPWTTVNS